MAFHCVSTHSFLMNKHLFTRISCLFVFFSYSSGSPPFLRCVVCLICSKSGFSYILDIGLWEHTTLSVTNTRIFLVVCGFPFYFFHDIFQKSSFCLFWWSQIYLFSLLYILIKKMKASPYLRWQHAVGSIIHFAFFLYVCDLFTKHHLKAEDVAQLVQHLT